MARRPSAHPTELELEILKILWREGPMPVRAVQDALADFRELALTSVTTVMTIMADKGYLSRRKAGGAFVYRARISRDKTLRAMLRDTVDRVFDGSAASAMVNLLETSRIRPEELEELQRLIALKAREESQ